MIPYIEFLRRKMALSATFGQPVAADAVHPVLSLISRYSNPGDLVFDPFGGLATVPMRALRHGRRDAGSSSTPHPHYPRPRLDGRDRRLRGRPALAHH